jgi:predicted acylesterase/phospholipase RssA
MKALVLGGGGAHGAYEAGVAKALLERESYDLICGVSIGAVNGAFIAAGNPDALERFWHDILPARAHELFPHVPRLRRLLGRIESIGRGSAWTNALQVAQAAGDLPFLRSLGSVHKTSLRAVAGVLSELVDFANLRTSLLIGATNASRGTAAVFRAYAGPPHPPQHLARLLEYHDLNADNFVMALLASAAMPGLFSPVELTFNGKAALYADGCIAHTSPLGLAIDDGADEVTVVFVDPEPDPQSAGSALGIAQMAFSIAMLWQQRLLDSELRLAEATNEIVRLGGAPGKRQITIRTVRPAHALELDILSLDAPSIAKAFALGVADGKLGPRVALPGFAATPEAPSLEAASPFRDFFRRLFPGPELEPK